MKHLIPLLTLVLFFQVSPVAATKTCPPPPCRDSKGSFNEAKCRSLAHWIAVGTIRVIYHNPEGHPLKKDFIRFMFTPKRWEKGDKGPMKPQEFQVGWCHNQVSPPNPPKDEEERGEWMVRVYGETPSEDGMPRYLDIVDLEN